MKNLRVIAITHQQFPLTEIGRFHLAPDNRKEALYALKKTFGIEELMYLSTCNRVEFVFTLPHFICPGFTARFIAQLMPGCSEEEASKLAAQCQRYNEAEAAIHLLNVASSLDSVILGEQEIITQLRKAFEESHQMQLSGDSIRLLMKQCIKTSKEIFTKTDLSKKPVSAVSLAWQVFQQRIRNKNARILLIGAGQVIRNFSKFLYENGFRNVLIANRTEANAAAIANALGFQHSSLTNVAECTNGFDALITCTASEQAVITAELYNALLKGSEENKTVIDLALPADVLDVVVKNHNIHYTGMSEIQAMASANMQFRKQAIDHCAEIIEKGKTELEKLTQERQIERAMKAIPEAVKEIRNTALGSVFAKDLEQLDSQSREVIEKIMAYMEKKYISIPMKMAREVLLSETTKN